MANDSENSSANPGKIIRAGILALVKGLLISGALMGPGFLLLIIGAIVPGMIWLFISSFSLMAWTYRKPWKLNLLSCLMPCAVTGLCLIVQMMLLRRVLPPTEFLILALLVGGGLGAIRSVFHKLHCEPDGSVMARRTLGYLIIWIVAYALTQLAAYLSRNTILIQGSVLTSVLSAAAIGVFSLCLLLRMYSVRKKVMVTNVIILFVSVLSLTPSLYAQVPSNPQVSERTLRALKNFPRNPQEYDLAIRELDPIYRKVMTPVVQSVLGGGFQSQGEAGRRSEFGNKLGNHWFFYDFWIAGEWIPVSGGKKRAVSINSQIHYKSGKIKHIEDLFIPGGSDKGWGYKKELINFHGMRAIHGTNSGGKSQYIYWQRGDHLLKLSLAHTSPFTKAQIVEVATKMHRAAKKSGYYDFPGSLLGEVAKPPVSPSTTGAGHSSGSQQESQSSSSSTDSSSTGRPRGRLMDRDTAIVTTSIVAILLAGGSISMQVSQAIAQALQEASIPDGKNFPTDASTSSPVPKPPVPIIDPDGDPVIIQDGSYEGGRPGQWWVYDGWMDPDEARSVFAERRRQLAERQREIDAFMAETDRLSEERRVFNEEEARRNELEREAERREQQAREEFERKRREHIASRMAEAAADPDNGLSPDYIQGLIRSGEHDVLYDLYRDKLEADTSAAKAEASQANAEAWRAGVAADGAGLVRTAAQGAIMTLGGPAGFVPTALASGAISGAGEGADAYYSGKDPHEVLRQTAAGFASGVKDAGSNAIARLPGVGWAGRNVLPAAADAVETYVRTGDAGKAAATGAINLLSGAAGEKIDALENGLAREGAELLNTSLTGGSTSVVNGGSFGEGASSSLAHHLAGRLGGKAGEEGAGHTRPRSESRILTAREEGKQASRRAEQGPITQQLQESQRDVPVLGRDGNQLVNPRTGKPVTESLVDTKIALQQLADPAESRTAKGADPDFVAAVIRTRNEQIYGPANDATIDAVTPRLQEAGILQPGDRLVMDTFSTPGAAPSLGADRDARLVIERYGQNGQRELIEVPRTHWERQAQADFASHTRPLAGDVTQDSHPDYFRRKEELAHLEKAGWTQQQIDDRAWNEAHNQLYTDGEHVEAGKDNSDQSGFRRDSSGREHRVGRSQIESPVLAAQAGRGLLRDPEGLGRMWAEKSHFYGNNTPEALAQSQKGIDSYLRLRTGYRSHNMDVPPINPKLGRAMELLSKAPTGQAATPEAMAKLTNDLQAEGFRDAHDAMNKVALSYESLKLSRRVAPVGLGSRGITSVATQHLTDERNEN